jgi:hypothetical protein
MNIAQIMQQAKVMQTRMAELQEQMGYERVTGTAGNGLVTVVMTCKGYVEVVTIHPSILDPLDPSMAEDLVKTAMNDGRKKADEKIADETKKMMESMGLPSNTKLPF